MERAPTALAATAAVIVLAVSAAALRGYPGAPLTFLLFAASFLGVLLLAIPRPRSYVYTFLAALLFLGFWLKIIVHCVWGRPFSESVGQFDYGGTQWDEALLGATSAACGVLMARIAYLVSSRRAGQRTAAEPPGVPAWYPVARTPLWIVSLVLTVVFNALNLQFAFLQVGVNPKWILPAHLTAVAVWLINTGLALWFAALVFWDLRLHAAARAYVFIGPLLEATLSSFSTLSRLFFLLHAGPYLLALFEARRTLKLAVSRSAAVALGFTLVVGLAVSLVVVSWLRIEIYFRAYEPALVHVPQQEKVIAQPVPGVQMHELISSAAREVARLFVDRWVGLEGVLAAASYPERGLRLFSEAMRDRGELGRDSLYQRISQPDLLLHQPERFTFLSNAGLVALLLLSGSKVLVGIGTAAVMLVMLGTEALARRLTANPFLLSVAGFAMANVVAQMTFPYLTLIFFLQLWTGVLFLGALQHARLFRRDAR